MTVPSSLCFSQEIKSLDHKVSFHLFELQVSVQLNIAFLFPFQTRSSISRNISFVCFSETCFRCSSVSYKQVCGSSCHLILNDQMQTGTLILKSLHPVCLATRLLCSNQYRQIPAEPYKFSKRWSAFIVKPHHYKQATQKKKLQIHNQLWFIKTWTSWRVLRWTCWDRVQTFCFPR